MRETRSLLPPAQVDPLRANLCIIPGGEGRDVRAERARGQDPLVPLLVERGAEQHVVAEARVEDPQLLGAVRHRPPERDERSLVTPTVVVAEMRRMATQLKFSGSSAMVIVE